MTDSHPKTPTHWIRNSDLPSQRWPLRVMAEAEGYAMVRFKGCTPFVITVKELKRDYVEAANAD